MINKIYRAMIIDGMLSFPHEETLSDFKEEEEVYIIKRDDMRELLKGKNGKEINAYDIPIEFAVEFPQELVVEIEGETKRYFLEGMIYVPTDLSDASVRYHSIDEILKEEKL